MKKLIGLYLLTCGIFNVGSANQFPPSGSPNPTRFLGSPTAATQELLVDSADNFNLDGIEPNPSQKKAIESIRSILSFVDKQSNTKCSMKILNIDHGDGTHSLIFRVSSKFRNFDVNLVKDGESPGLKMTDDSIRLHSALSDDDYKSSITLKTDTKYGILEVEAFEEDERTQSRFSCGLDLKK